MQQLILTHYLGQLNTQFQLYMAQNQQNQVNKIHNEVEIEQHHCRHKCITMYYEVLIENYTLINIFLLVVQHQQLAHSYSLLYIIFHLTKYRNNDLIFFPLLSIQLSYSKIIRLSNEFTSKVSLQIFQSIESLKQVSKNLEILSLLFLVFNSFRLLDLLRAQFILFNLLQLQLKFEHQSLQIKLAFIYIKLEVENLKQLMKFYCLQRQSFQCYTDQIYIDQQVLQFTCLLVSFILFDYKQYGSSNINNINKNMNIRTIICIIVVVEIMLIKGRVLEITNNNLENVLKVQNIIHVLFHHPKCQQSKNYKQQFMKFGDSNNLGVVDCLQQNQFCLKNNITTYPKLMKITMNQSIQINHWEFVGSNHDNPQFLARKIVDWLRQNQYVTVILEEQGLPIIDRITNVDKILYLQPSKLSEIIYNLVGKSYGCWILKKDNNSDSLNKYSCGLGQNSQKVLLSIEDFKAGKIQSYQINQGKTFRSALDISLEEFQQFIKHPKNALIYFYSKYCSKCNIKKDIQLIKSAVGNQQFRVYAYNADQNQLPSLPVHAKIKRFPQVLKIQINQVQTEQQPRTQLKLLSQVINIRNIKILLKRQSNFKKNVKKQEQL